MKSPPRKREINQRRDFDSYRRPGFFFEQPFPRSGFDTRQIATVPTGIQHYPGSRNTLHNLYPLHSDVILHQNRIRVCDGIHRNRKSVIEGLFRKDVADIFTGERRYRRDVSPKLFFRKSRVQDSSNIRVIDVTLETVK